MGICQKHYFHHFGEEVEWLNKAKIHYQKYNDAKETKPIIIGESGMIKFTRHFKYLGSYISYSLKYYYDIAHITFQDGMGFFCPWSL